MLLKFHKNFIADDFLQKSEENRLFLKPVIRNPTKKLVALQPGPTGRTVRPRHIMDIASLV